MVYEIIERTPKHHAVTFSEQEWKARDLPEPEDFIGHLLPLPLTLEVFKSHIAAEVARGRRKVLAVDFDGVIAEYYGWKGSKVFGEPLPLVKECLQAIRDAGWSICIWTTREPVGVWHYCTQRGIPVDSINAILFRPWAKRKICADVYLDDRGLKFPGGWSKDLVTTILSFQTWWEIGGGSEDFVPLADETVLEAVAKEIDQRSSLTPETS
jgi:adenylylsulfate kinase